MYLLETFLIFSRVKTDLDNSLQYLTGTFEEGSLNVVTLLLTGRATPHLHNGVIHVGDEDNYALPQYGVLNRCSVGLLIFENEKRVVSIYSFFYNRYIFNFMCTFSTKLKRSLILRLLHSLNKNFSRKVALSLQIRVL